MLSIATHLFWFPSANHYWHVSFPPGPVPPPAVVLLSPASTGCNVCRTNVHVLYSLRQRISVTENRCFVKGICLVEAIPILAWSGSSSCTNIAFRAQTSHTLPLSSRHTHVQPYQRLESTTSDAFSAAEVQFERKSSLSL
jgi:hypothetical protein